MARVRPFGSALLHHDLLEQQLLSPSTKPLILPNECDHQQLLSKSTISSTSTPRKGYTSPSVQQTTSSHNLVENTDKPPLTEMASYIYSFEEEVNWIDYLTLPSSKTKHELLQSNGSNQKSFSTDNNNSDPSFSPEKSEVSYIPEWNIFDLCESDPEQDHTVVYDLPDELLEESTVIAKSDQSLSQIDMTTETSSQDRINIPSSSQASERNESSSLVDVKFQQTTPTVQKTTGSIVNKPTTKRGRKPKLDKPNDKSQQPKKAHTKQESKPVTQKKILPKLAPKPPQIDQHQQSNISILYLSPPPQLKQLASTSQGQEPDKIFQQPLHSKNFMILSVPQQTQKQHHKHLQQALQQQRLPQQQQHPANVLTLPAQQQPQEQLQQSFQRQQQHPQEQSHQPFQQHQEQQQHSQERLQQPFQQQHLQEQLQQLFQQQQQHPREQLQQSFQQQHQQHLQEQLQQSFQQQQHPREQLQQLFQQQPKTQEQMQQLYQQQLPHQQAFGTNSSLLTQTQLQPQQLLLPLHKHTQGLPIKSNTMSAPPQQSLSPNTQQSVQYINNYYNVKEQQQQQQQQQQQLQQQQWNGALGVTTPSILPQQQQQQQQQWNTNLNMPAPEQQQQPQQWNGTLTPSILPQQLQLQQPAFIVASPQQPIPMTTPSSLSTTTTTAMSRKRTAPVDMSDQFVAKRMAI